MIKNFLLKKPYSISITITNQCNSRCIYCNYWKTKNPTHLTPEDLETLFNKSKILRDVKQISITGGEPTLNPHFTELFDVIFKYTKPVKVSLVSNGLSVKIPDMIKKVVDKHGKKNFRMKFSLDGTRDYYKKTRGVDGYHLVVRNIEAVSKIIDDVSIGFTITDHNHEDLKNISNMFKDKVIAHPVEQIQAYGSTATTTKELPKLTHKHPVFKLYYAYLRRAMKAKKRIHKCYAGTLSICLNQSLDVTSCIKVPSKFGNLRDYDMNFDKLWNENIERVRHEVDTKGCHCFCTGDIIPSILRDYRWLLQKP